MLFQSSLIKSQILFMMGLLCIVFFTACGGPTPTPTPVAQIPTETPVPTNTPIPTNTPEPPRVEVNVSESIELQLGESVTIQAEASGAGKITYEWTLIGVGDVSEERNAPLIIYRAPESVEDGKNTAGLSVTVSNEGGDTIKGVSITIVTPTPEPPTNTPPPLTNTSTPTPTEPTVTNTPTPPSGPITITNPTNNESVDCENLAEGTYAEDITEPIWPIVFIGNRYHPQDEGGLAPPKVNGEWFGTVRFGNCNEPEKDVGNRFQLIVVAAGQNCNQAFEAYLTKGQETGDWPGILRLEDDCKEHIRIVVTRK